MGRDKALLPFRGGLLAGVVARAVEEAAGSVTVVGRSELLDLPAIPDLYPGEGPLGGILTALAHSRSEWNLVAACDMPGITAGFLRSLLDRAESSACDVLIPHGPSGHPEPLCAVYRSTARDAIEGHFARGIRKVTAALEGLDVQLWGVSQVAHFENVNTPEEWAGHASE
jgi:molybdopterin-guanine dinucleotide biosynthesis protein A